MKNQKKAAGFFIVEVLVVLVIIGILVTALMPNLTTYTQRAKFVDNLSAANAVKASVEGCLLQRDGALTDCSATSYGIPANITTGYSGTNGNVAGVSVASGVITVTSTAKFGPAATTSYTYILTPTYSNGVVTWVATGTCAVQGLC